MRAAARALQALIAVGIALILVAPAAQADVLDESSSLTAPERRANTAKAR
jgi:hypothetical protein